eukprot:Hpha_TRINITY_DN31348_c0_g1::TRINITY_DN31348_c0_g1_i1::g.194559::m.194559
MTVVEGLPVDSGAPAPAIGTLEEQPADGDDEALPLLPGEEPLKAPKLPTNEHSDRDLLDAHLARPLPKPMPLPPPDLAAARQFNLDLKGDAAEDEEFKGRAFMVDGLLTPDECDALMRSTEEGLEDLLLCDGKNRRCRRLAFRCPELDQRIWERVRPMLGDEVCHEGNRHRFLTRGMEGRWEPSGLSGVLRVVKYLPGGHIAPHYDGEWVTSEDERSLKTILLYLNEGYAGGETRLLDHRDEEVCTRYYTTEGGALRAAEEDVMGVVPLMTGGAIVFDAKMLHEGCELRSGEKWLLRADVVYKRVERTFSGDSERAKATQFLNDAELCELEGDYESAVRYYRKAYRLCPELQRE